MKLNWIIVGLLSFISIVLLSMNSKIALIIDYTNNQNKKIQLLDVETDMLLKSNVLLLKDLYARYQIQIELSDEYSKKYFEMENKSGKERE